MKKTMRNFVGFFSIVMMLVGLIAGTAAVSADTTTQTETFKVTGYETATQQDLTGMIASMPITVGVTGDGLVAEGYNAALKISSLGPNGNGQNYAYLINSSTLKAPFTTVPEELSKWETMKFYLSHEALPAGSTPFGLQVYLLGADSGPVAGAYVLLDHVWENHTPTGKYWVELKPSDFYAFVNYAPTSTKLTSFPNAYTIGFRLDNSMSPIGVENGKDEKGTLAPHYLYYSGADCWAAIDLYISGLQYTRKVAVTTTTTTTTTVGGNGSTTTTTVGGTTTTTTGTPEVENNDPFAPTDNYVHTYFPDLENCTQEEADKFPSSVKVNAGITDPSLIAPGATSGIHMDYTGQNGWGMIIFAEKGPAGENLFPINTVPANMSEFDGMRFYLKAVKGSTELPQTITLRLINGYMMEAATATIDIYDEDGIFSDWIYLTPADFGFPLGFPPCSTLEFKMGDDYHDGDGSCDYDLYFSGLSYYKKGSSGDLDNDLDNDLDDEIDDEIGNVDTGVVAGTAGTVVLMVASLAVICTSSRRKNRRA